MHLHHSCTEISGQPRQTDENNLSYTADYCYLKLWYLKGTPHFGPTSYISLQLNFCYLKLLVFRVNFSGT